MVKIIYAGKGVQPTFVRVMKSRRSGIVAVRINVRAADIKEILEQNFGRKMYTQWNGSPKINGKNGQ
jgi:hypothetical protein